MFDGFFYVKMIRMGLETTGTDGDDGNGDGVGMGKTCLGMRWRWGQLHGSGVGLQLHPCVNR